MKQFLSSLILLFFAHTTEAQNLAGYYKDEGYFFHPTDTRSFNLAKTLVKVGANRYELDLGDLGTQDYKFQFDVDEINNLVNWSAVNSTPPVPASNFMTMDDPGNFYFNPSAGSIGLITPGFTIYVQTNYNNTYDPITKSFYFHYGYGAGSISQNDFSRQVYEKLTLIQQPVILSVAPMTGSALTKVTIRGKNFFGVDPGHGISFGNLYPDSTVVVSDSVITAWIGSGATGNVRLSNDYLSDSLPGFTYTPVAPVTNMGGWQYLGNSGFSAGKGYSVNAVVNKNNIPYVVFIDSLDGKVHVMKFEGSNWKNVGNAISDGISGNTKISADSTGNPLVAYLDQSIPGLIKVKKFDGNNWVDLNIPLPSFSVGHYSFAADKLNNIYVPISGYEDSTIDLLFYNGSTWTTTFKIGVMPYPYSDFDITLGKNNAPYLLFADNINLTRNQMSVKKMAGTSWVYAGTSCFTSGLNGIFYPTITTDTSGDPMVVFQENNGFQRLSTYKFEGSNWTPQSENFFSNSRSHFVSLTIDRTNKPSVAFIDSSYNGRGTVLTLNTTQGSWDYSGVRGFLPCLSLGTNALLTDSANNTLIFFSDVSQNGRVSVMKLRKDFIWTGAVSNAWENPGNWNNGVVPTASGNVFINAGGIVKLSSNTSVNSIKINPSASFTILPAYSLTVTGH